MSIARATLALLAPPSCALCEATLPSDCTAGVCVHCRNMHHPWSAPPVPGTRTRRVCGVMDGHLRLALLRLKFHEETWRARGIGQWMAQCAWPDLPPIEPGTVVVPVPLSPRRLAQRGYNQAALLARAFAWAAQLPWAPALLRRDRELQALSRSGRAHRRAILGGFTAEGIVPQRVMLVDDVTTTGSTLEACAAALQQSGCLWVETLCAAGADMMAPPLGTRDSANSDS